MGLWEWNLLYTGSKAPHAKFSSFSQWRDLETPLCHSNRQHLHSNAAVTPLHPPKISHCTKMNSVVPARNPADSQMDFGPWCRDNWPKEGPWCSFLWLSILKIEYILIWSWSEFINLGWRFLKRGRRTDATVHLGDPYLCPVWPFACVLLPLELENAWPVQLPFVEFPFIEVWLRPYV